MDLTQLLTNLPMIASTTSYILGRAKVKASGETDKPGYKTTEFWLTAVVTIVTLIANILGVKVSG